MVVNLNYYFVSFKPLFFITHEIFDMHEMTIGESSDLSEFSTFLLNLGRFPIFSEFSRAHLAFLIE